MAMMPCYAELRCRLVLRRHASLSMRIHAAVEGDLVWGGRYSQCARALTAVAKATPAFDAIVRQLGTAAYLGARMGTLGLCEM